MTPYVSRRMASSFGCGYATRSRPCLRLMKMSTMPESSGPGRYNAPAAMMSSNTDGLSFFTISVKPEDSIWKIPAVSPLEISW